MIIVVTENQLGIMGAIESQNLQITLFLKIYTVLFFKGHLSVYISFLLVKLYITNTMQRCSNFVLGWPVADLDDSFC